MPKLTNADRIAKLKKSLKKAEVKEAEDLAKDWPDIARLAGLLTAPATPDLVLTPYDKAVAARLGVNENEFLEAKKNRPKNK